MTIQNIWAQVGKNGVDCNWAYLSSVKPTPTHPNLPFQASTTLSYAMKYETASRKYWKWLIKIPSFSYNLLSHIFLYSIQLESYPISSDPSIPLSLVNLIPAAKDKLKNWLGLSTWVRLWYLEFNHTKITKRPHSHNTTITPQGKSWKKKKRLKKLSIVDEGMRKGETWNGWEWVMLLFVLV